MNKVDNARKRSIWSILSECSSGCSFLTLYLGIDKMTNYHSGILFNDYSNSPVYSRTYNGITYKIDIAYGMSFRLVATRNG